MEILNPTRNTFSVRVKVEHFPMNLKISNLLFLAAKHKSKGSQEVLNMRSRLGQFFQTKRSTFSKWTSFRWKKTVPRIGGNSLRKTVQTKITHTHTAFPDSKISFAKLKSTSFFGVDTGTPWKINRWTLKVIPIEKPNHLPNPPFLCSMFIFQSEPKPINIYSILP